MHTTTQYRVAFTEDGQEHGTKWYESMSEALGSKWMSRNGAKIETRRHLVESLAENNAMTRQGARIVRASKYEISRMMERAMNEGRAFAAQRINATTYKVMEVAV